MSNDLQDNINSGNVKVIDDNFYFCKICLVDICGKAQAESHCSGGKHIKKIKHSDPTSNNGGASPSSTSRTGNTSPVDVTDLQSLIDAGYLTKISTEYKCVICNIGGMFGDVTVFSHLRGKSHLRKTNIHKLSVSSFIPRNENQIVQSPIVESCTIDSKTLFDDAVTKGYITGEITFGGQVRCELCKAVMTGSVPLETHLRGKDHKRKEEAKTLNQHLVRSGSLTPSPPDSRRSSLGTEMTFEIQESVNNGDVIVDAETNEYKCTICVTSMTGFSPLKAHLEGKAHQRKKRTASRMCELFPSSGLSSPSSYYARSPMSTSSMVNECGSPNSSIEELSKELQIIKEDEPIRGHPAMNSN